jgi:hypothetical protein
MASIQPITLTITKVPNSANVSISVGYVVSLSSHDIATEQHYREVCHLIGDDTPGDGTDDIIRTLFDTTTFFEGTFSHFSRAIQVFLPASALDEDSGRPFLEEDEIRARVTLTPIPTSRESNLVVIGGGPIVNQ